MRFFWLLEFLLKLIYHRPILFNFWDFIIKFLRFWVNWKSLFPSEHKFIIILIWDVQINVRFYYDYISILTYTLLGSYCVCWIMGWSLQILLQSSYSSVCWHLSNAFFYSRLRRLLFNYACCFSLKVSSKTLHSLESWSYLYSMKPAFLLS